MASMAPAPVPGAVPKKKISPLVWVLIAIGGLILLAILAVVGAGLFVAKKFADNPTMAAASIIAAANPDVEIVSSDQSGGTVTFREKSTGKTITLNLDQLKNGKFSFTEDGKEVSLSAGAGQSKLPAWVPSYPGAQISGAFSARDGDEETVNVGFTTGDSADKVRAFYEDAFAKGGLKITNTTTAENSTVVSAESESANRKVVLSLNSTGGQTTVGLTVNTK